MRRLASSPLTVPLWTAVLRGVSRVGFLLSTFHCCSPCNSTATTPIGRRSRASTGDDRRSKLVRLLECRRRQKAQHTTHNVGMIVVPVARVLDRVLTAPMRAPLKQTQLANEPRIVGQPRQTAREYRQAFEIDRAFRPRTADVFKLKF